MDNRITIHKNIEYNKSEIIGFDGVLFSQRNTLNRTETKRKP